MAEVLECSSDSISIRFKEPKNAITPGQSLVLYDEQGYLLAGGIIRKSG
jgi:tRNA U34 2-thiouridine synthase MnmA/TrmU